LTEVAASFFLPSRAFIADEFFWVRNIGGIAKLMSNTFTDIARDFCESSLIKTLGPTDLADNLSHDLVSFDLLH
jgi:hypothetical protein